MSRHTVKWIPVKNRLGEVETFPACLKCDGDVEWMDCEHCGGGGSVEVPNEDYGDQDEEVFCDDCRGEGGWWRCHTCTRVTPTERTGE